MKEIIKTLGKFTLPILVVVGLIFFQAQCDLSLPEYTAKIVNVGIQQGGINEGVPEVIKESTYKNLLIFVDEPDQELIEKSYRKIKESEFMDYVHKYPLLKEEELYIIKEDLDMERLTKTLSSPIMILSSLNNNEEITKKIIKILEETNRFPNNASNNEEIDIFKVIKSLDAKQYNNLLAPLNNEIEKLEESIIEQATIAFVKAEYNAIGLNMDKMQTNYILNNGLKMLGLSLLSMVIAITTAYIISQISSRFSCNLRSKLTKKVMGFSNKEFVEFSTASLITRGTNDIQQVQMLIMMFLRIVIYAPIIGIGAFLKVQNSEMSWVIALALSLILILTGTLLIFALPKFQKVQKTIDKLNLIVRQRLSGMPVIRAFSNQKYEEENFDETSTNLTKLNLFVNKTMAIMFPIMMLIMNGISVLIIWVGASKVDAGAMQVGDLMAFITYTMQIIMAFIMLTVMSIMFPRALISMKRIGEVFKKQNSIKETDDPKTFDLSKKGTVEFRDVYFRYPDANEDVLQNINFTAKKGTTTAFIGSTGSGKSTLVNLIPRFYDITAGKILIDGVDIRDVTFNDLRRKVGYVPQKGMLFSGTIASNIAFGKENLSKKEIEKSARIAQATDFIKNKKNKYDSEISQGGTNVSGGQRQRLAIARAIAIKPDIYIFDDSFSALDYQTDLKLRQELAKVTKNSTVFIVAQRISTVLKADQIIVLDQGEIVGTGTHKELMKNCEVYKEIALSQLSRKELENE